MKVKMKILKILNCLCTLLLHCTWFFTWKLEIIKSRTVVSSKVSIWLDLFTYIVHEVKPYRNPKYRNRVFSGRTFFIFYIFVSPLLGLRKRFERNGKIRIRVKVRKLFKVGMVSIILMCKFYWRKAPLVLFKKEIIKLYVRTKN